MNPDTCKRLPRTLTIGDLLVDSPCYQAALSGYTDRAMRTIARAGGARLTFAGVMLDKITLHPKVLRKPAFVVGDDEHPIGAQILGTDPDIMAAAARALHEIGYDLIDLNFACPAPKVLRRGRGGALMKTPARAIEILRRVRDAVSCPVMMKLRMAFDETELERENLFDICAQAARSGVDAVAVHGRTVLQRYREKSDWNVLKLLKQQHPELTIIGSGDVFTAETAVQRLAETGIDGILIARGAIGNPWIFNEQHAMVNGLAKPEPPSVGEQGRVMLRHFEMVLDLYESHKAVIYFRKFSIRYVRRHPQRKRVHMELLTAADVPSVRAVIKRYYGLT